MSAIQDSNWLYSTLRYYVDSTFNLAYRRIQYKGTDRIPKDGAIIFAPNHTNALMDALAVLVVDHTPTVFVARADIFKKSSIAKILHFFKIMPIMRIRDGYSNLKKNEEIMKEAVQVLEHKIPFCIMAEGTHRPMHSLLPLVKGIFRIALMTNSELGGHMPVYIVPLGIEYGDYFRYRSTLLLQVGEPINITEFVRSNPNLDTAEQFNLLRDILSEKMKQNILYINDSPYYDATYDLCLIGQNDVLAHNQQSQSTLYDELTAKQFIATSVSECTQAEPLLEQAASFSKARHQAKIADDTLLTGSWSIAHFITKSVTLLLTFPYFIFAAIATAPITLCTAWLTSKMDDRAFDNSVRYVMVLLLSPIIWLLLAILFFSVTAWPIALIATIALLPTHIFIHFYWRTARLIYNQILWFRQPSLRKQWLVLKEKLHTLIRK